MPPELWIGTPIDVMQRHSRYIQASEYIKELTEQRDMLVEEQNLLKQCLSAMPVGYIPTHTAENLPEMICDLAKALAEETTERENLECELDAMTGQRDRLAEALTSIMPIFNFKYLSHEEKQKVRYASEVIAVIKGGNNE